MEAENEEDEEEEDESEREEEKDNRFIDYGHENKYRNQSFQPGMSSLIDSVFNREVGEYEGEIEDNEFVDEVIQENNYFFNC